MREKPRECLCEEKINTPNAVGYVFHEMISKQAYNDVQNKLDIAIEVLESISINIGLDGGLTVEAEEAREALEKIRSEK